MSEAATQAKPARGFAARLWEYQAERFPVFKHGALIAAFGASAVGLSGLLRGVGPHLAGVPVAIIVLFCFFFQLRVADEHKDNEDDTKYRPERPVPRGLVTLAELRWVAFALVPLQIALAVWLDWRLIGLLALAWAWMAVMTKEFFVPAWLKKHPVIYMVSHMAIMPLIDLFATACDWMPRGKNADETFGLTLGAFLLLSLVNGTMIELSRKSWSPEQERDGVETYSKLWGAARAGIVIMCVVLIGLALSAFINVRTPPGGHLFLLGGLTLVSAWAAWTAIDYSGTPTPKTAKAMETASGVYVLANYLLLGVLPWIMLMVAA